jgi:PAS domain S-box-containing protein
MWIAGLYVLLCSIVGTVLAVVAGVLWQLVPVLSGTGEMQIDVLNLLALGILGAVTAGLVGVGMSLAGQVRQRSTVPASSSPVLAPARRERALRARVSLRYRWEAISPSLCRLLGRRARDLRGRPIFETLHPGDLGALEQALHRTQQSGRPETLNCRFLVPLNEPAGPFARTTFRSDTQVLPPLDPASFRHMRLRLRLCARAAGPAGPAHFRCRFIDRRPPAEYQQELDEVRQEADLVEHRLRRVSADLSRLKKSYFELYQNAPVMYFRLDVNGRLVAFNDTLTRTLGHTRRDLAQHSYADLLAPVDGARAALPLGQAPFQEGEVETRWRSGDGAVLDVWIRTVADRDERGKVVRYRSAAIDLTEKNRLANELRARGDDLERANDRLRTINSELEDFTYVVSHDLKEPLRTLQTYGHRLAEEYSAQLGADGFQYINHLIGASRRLGLLIDDLLNLSQAGRMARSTQPFDLIEAVATARQDLVDLIQRKEATVLTEGSLPRVVGDRYRITQLLTNLIANGLKYNQSGQPEVVIAAAERPGPGGPREVVVSVRDNGIGIDPAYHAQIFGMFRRLHKPDEYEGTGAGLAICKKIVEAHDGRIWVESQPGQGATFFFTLPNLSPRAASATPRAGRLPRPAGEAPPRPAPAETASTGSHIVLVEDEEDPALIVQDHGRQAGQTVTWFATAEEAWEYLQGHGADLLLFDINLRTSEIDGVELCRRVRTLAGLRQTPVVLFERDQSPERVAELRAAGADFVLSKDLLANVAAWQRRLGEILEQRRVPSAV